MPGDEVLNHSKTCSVQPVCNGAQLPPYKGCLEHLTLDELTAYLSEASTDGVLNARGVRFSDLLFRRVFSPKLLERIRVAHCEDATFADDVTFDGITFEAELHFRGAQFRGDASFEGAIFKSLLDLEKTVFHKDLILHKAQFEFCSYFGPCLVRKHLCLDLATFKDPVVIDVATFVTTCNRTEFSQGVTLFLGPRSHLILERCTLGGSSFLAESNHFTIDRDFADTAEESTKEVLYADDWFDKTTSIPQDVIFGVPSRESYEYFSDHFDSWGGKRPRLLSLRETDVESLTISQLDLAPCRFIGASSLDRLRLEGGPALFAVAGQPVSRRSLSALSAIADWPILRWLFPISGWSIWGTVRQSIAEEHLYRRRSNFVRRVSWEPRRSSRWYGYRYEDDLRKLDNSSWYPRRCWMPKSLEQYLAVTQPPEAEEVVSAYRALRKAREDSKDEPGAADFYYGEMEMRRISPWTRKGERSLLWLYRIISGYGVRASRALLSLAVTVLIFAIVMDLWGFRDPQNLLEALAFSIQSTTSLLRPPEIATTTIGTWVNIALRLLGPLLFALTFLSLRGRVKR